MSRNLWQKLQLCAVRLLRHQFNQYFTRKRDFTKWFSRSTFIFKKIKKSTTLCVKSQTYLLFFAHNTTMFLTSVLVTRNEFVVHLRKFKHKTARVDENAQVTRIKGKVLHQTLALRSCFFFKEFKVRFYKQRLQSLNVHYLGVC